MATKTSHFLLTCPFCGDREAAITCTLGELSVCSCSSCHEEFTPQQARDKAARLLAEWEHVVGRAESASAGEARE